MAQILPLLDPDKDADLIKQGQVVIASFRGIAANSSKKILKTVLREFRNASASTRNDGTRETLLAFIRSILEFTLQEIASTPEIRSGFAERQRSIGSVAGRNNGSRDPVGVPENVRLRSTGKTGEVQVLCGAVPRARAYQVQFADDPTSAAWCDGGTFVSTRSMVTKNLIRAKDYWIRVRAIGPGGPGQWSDPAAILVS